MKRFLYITALLALLTAIWGCTRHNGDIGPWFGTWHVEAITVDGHPDGEYRGTLFMKFQGDVVNMTVVNDFEHTRADHWGRWSATSDELTLDYTYGDNITPAATGRYAPPAISLLPGGVTRLRILKLTGSRLELRYENAEGEVIDYFLKKW
ncbi:MAG: lipocalin family protein [Bacteroides sp.]|nr:lipocalin family protein [Bacteroides sp.]